MRQLLILFLAFPLLTMQASEQYSWFADLEPITLDTINRIQLLAVFMDASNPVLSPDGHYLAFTNSQNRLTVFDTYTGLNRSYVARGQVVFSPDSSLLAFSDGSSALRILHLNDGHIQEFFPFDPNERPYELWAITPDNTRLIANVFVDSVDANRCAKVIDLTIETEAGRGNCFFHTGEPLVLTPDGQYYTYRQGYSIQVREVHSGDLIIEVPYANELADVALWLMTDNVLITPERVRSHGDSETTYVTDILITNLQTFETVRILTNHRDINNTGLYYDGSKLLMVVQGQPCSLPTSLRTYDLQTLIEVTSLNLNLTPNGEETTSRVAWTAVNSDATIAAVVNFRWECRDGSPRVLDSLTFWDVNQRHIVKQLPLSSFAPAQIIEFSSDDRLLITSWRNVTQLWGVVPQPYRLPVIDGDFSPSSRFAISPTTLVCANSPQSRLNIGFTAYVPTTAEVDTNIELRVREQPNGEQIGSLIPGEQVQLIGGPVCDENGILWWGIQSLDNPELSGWSIEAINTSDYILIPE